MLESLYCIHGLGLRFTTDSPRMATAVQAHMRHFRRPTLHGSQLLECSVRGVHTRAEIPISASPAAHLLCTNTWEILGSPAPWQCHLLRDDTYLIADFHEHGMLRIDEKQGRAEGYVIHPEGIHPDILASVFHHFALTELLKRQGLYTIHAAALEKHGCGLLIPGASGRGKTTSCIALLRAGYRCLSDDHPLLHARDTDLEILSFPVKIDVTATTVAFFPELQDINTPLYQGIFKQYFYADTLYPASQTEVCDPVLIIFPQVVNAPRSVLEPLPKSRALEEFLPQGLLVLDQEVAKQQFQALSRLIHKAACYRLYFGADVLDLPQLVNPLLERARA